jgi:quinol monooxygenase YgiN
MPVIAVAHMFGLSGLRTELRALLESFEREAAGAPGCRRYTFAATLADPDAYLLLSEWDEPAALDAHYRSQAFSDFQFGLHALLAQPSQLSIYAAAAAVRPLDSAPMDPRDAD